MRTADIDRVRVFYVDLMGFDLVYLSRSFSEVAEHVGVHHVGRRALSE